jgi:pyridoxal phosphate enzyme (YggS family)
MQAENDIAGRLGEVRDRIAAAAKVASREPKSIRLVLASKTQSADIVRAAYDAGARDFGENYVQEAVEKHRALASLHDIRWHLIGHLQTNKARQACSIFHLIHSLDSARLAHAIHRAHPASRFPVLIEVNLGGEGSKHGTAADEVERLINDVREQVDIEGLMAIPPPVSEPGQARPYFSRLRTMRDSLAARCGLALAELSMGMTDDFEVAIEEGATMVRIGRAIFGERRR